MFSFSGNCEMSSTQFTDMSYAPGGVITGWYWEFDDGNTSTLQNPSHVYISAGIYNVTLIVTNNFDCPESITIPVTVNSQPVADFDYNSDYCTATLVHFQDKSVANNTAITERLWIFEPGQFGEGQYATHTFPYPDSLYPVTLIVTDGNGCMDTIVDTIDLKPQFQLQIQDTTVCFGDTTQFHAKNLAGSGDPLKNFKWNFGDPPSGPNNTSTEKDPEHVFTSTGPFTVTLTASNSNNCEQSTFTYVYLWDLPVADFSFDPVPYCEIDTVIFHNLSTIGFGSAIDSVVWDFGDTTYYTQYPPRDTTHHHYKYFGQYTVKLTAYNSNRCHATREKDIVVTCIAAGIQIKIDTSLICTSNHVAFHDSSTPQSLITSRQWDFGDPASGIYNTSTAKDTIHVFDTAGTYTVRLTVNTIVNGVTISSVDSIKIHLKTSSIPDFQAENVCLGNPVRFDNLCDTSVISIENYHWIFGDGTTADTLETTHLYSAPKWYNVTLKIRNQFKCVDSITKMVRIYRNPVSDFTTPDVCSRDYINISDSSREGDTTINFWSWQFTDQNMNVIQRTGKNPVFIYNQEGQYPVYLKVKDMFQCYDTITKLINVLPTPISSFTVIDDYKEKQGQIQLDNQSSGAATYQWDFGNGKSSVEENPVTNYTMDGTYVIRLITSNGLNNCTDTTFYKYEVLFKGLYVPNAFAPGSTNLAIRLFKPVGRNLKQYDIQVYDYMGHLLWESAKLDSEGRPLEGWDGKVNGELLPQGTYMWKASATFIDETMWEGSDIGKGEFSTMGTVSLIR
jgi:PKD repeat protein